MSKPVGAQDDSFLGDELITDLQADSTPLCASAPIVTNTVPAEFDDLAIQMVQDLLHKHHPDIARLQFVSLGEFRCKQLPKFASAAGVRFVQILNVGDHWLCVTNIFGSSSHDLYVYDSLQRKRLSDNAITQISSILRDDGNSETLKVHIRKFVRQPARSRACVLYAVAAAFACCNREDPTGMYYDVEQLRETITSRVLHDRSESICRERNAGKYKTFNVFQSQAVLFMS